MQTNESLQHGSGNKDAPSRGGSRTKTNLDHGARAFLETSFGESFEDVRVRERAGGLPPQALAGATGGEIVLRGSFSRSGHPLARAVLAHEAAHVLQWRRGRQGAGPSWSESRLEAEAAEAGVAAAQGARPAIQGVAVSARPRYHPIFVATQGTQTYFKFAKRFFAEWGYGTPESISSLEEILEKLADGSSELDRITIVSHAWPGTIKTSFLRGGPPEITIPDLKRKTAADLRGYIQHVRDEVEAGGALELVRDDSANAELLNRLKLDIADHDVKQYLWWLVDADYLRRVKPSSAIPERDKVLAAADSNVKAYADLLRARRPPAPPPAEGATPPPDDFDSFEAAVKKQLAIDEPAYAEITPAEGKQYSKTVLGGSDPAVRRLLSSAGPGAAGSTTFEAALAKASLRFGNGSEIEIRGCRVGQNPAYLKELSRFFGHTVQADDAGAPPEFIAPKVSGPDMFQGFGGLGLTSHEDNPVTLKGLWSNQDIREAFIYWAPILRAPISDPPVAEDLVNALRDRFVFPVETTLHALRGQDPGGVPAWLARFGYLLSEAPAIETKFFGNWTTAGTEPTPVVDWLQDKRPEENPTKFIFPPDPSYSTHFITEQASEP